MKKNIKCTKCGYVFEYDGSGNMCRCPLCSHEFAVSDGIDSLKIRGEENIKKHKKKSTARIILDWAIFGVAFAVFIVVMHLMIGFIVNS